MWISVCISVEIVSTKNRKIETLMDDICLNVPLAVFKYHDVKSQINDPNSVDFFFYLCYNFVGLLNAVNM